MRICRRVTFSEGVPLANLLVQAINCDDGNQAARIIQDALGIEGDDVVSYCFPKARPNDRERRARIIGEWLKTEARYLASRADNLPHVFQTCPPGRSRYGQARERLQGEGASSSPGQRDGAGTMRSKTCI